MYFNGPCFSTTPPFFRMKPLHSEPDIWSKYWSISAIEPIVYHPDLLCLDVGKIVPVLHRSVFFRESLNMVDVFSLLRVVPDMEVSPLFRMTKTQIMIGSNHAHATGDGRVREIYYPGSVSRVLTPLRSVRSIRRGKQCGVRSKHHGDWWDNYPRNISYMISISCVLIPPEIKAPKRFVIIW